jgi:hypothetical protein
MIEEIDIYRTANVLIGQHGGGALLEAMNRVEKYRVIGNNHGMAVWRRISDAIENIQMPAHLTSQTIQ